MEETGIRKSRLKMRVFIHVNSWFLSFDPI